MQPIIVLPKNISDKVKHAFCILKLNFCYNISPQFCCLFPTNIIKSILKCTKGFIFVMKLLVPNDFPNQNY